MPIEPRGSLKGNSATKRGLRMPLKTSVAISLVVSLGLLTLIMIAGLIVPKSVLLKLSKNSDASAQKASVAETVSSASAGINANQNSVSDQPATTTPATSAPTSTSPTSTSTNPSTATKVPAATTPVGTTTAKVAPTLTFSGSPTSVTSGSTVVLSWTINSTATAPVTCTGAGGSFAGAKATSGSQSVSQTSTTSYTLACTNVAGSSGTNSVTISVAAPASACGTSGGACTTAQIATHNTAGNCWVIYNSNYLILSGTGRKGSNGDEVANHNGGSSRITPYCGGNATTGFNAQHGSQSGVKSIFNTYVVGPVQ